MDKVENIGLIGYGVIGKAIAKELMKSYYHVFVYDNSESEMILAKKQGCYTCASPQDVSLKTKIILLSVPKSILACDDPYPSAKDELYIDCLLYTSPSPRD